MKEDGEQDRDQEDSCEEEPGHGPSEVEGVPEAVSLWDHECAVVGVDVKEASLPEAVVRGVLARLNACGHPQGS